LVAAAFGSPGQAQAPIYSPTPIAYEWSGFYLGATAGWIWADIDATELFSEEFGVYMLPGDPYEFDTEGFIGGAEIGYDWRWNHFVIGAAAQVGYLDLRGSIQDPNSLPTGAPTTYFNAHLYGELTGRVGFAWNRVFPYVRGGVAFLDATGGTLDSCGRSFCGPTTIDASSDELLTGWILGAGLEFKVLEHWAAGLEYKYINFEEMHVSGISVPTAEYSQELDVDSHSVRATLKYKW